MRTKLYVEGGGDSKVLRTACRRGFREFIQRAGLEGRMPQVIACGGRESAYDSFVTALAAGENSPLLLVDSEGPVTANGPWAHLAARDGWSRPAEATDAQCHLMTQVMESWFLADRSALRTHYGQHFQENALPAREQVEDIPKAAVLSGLKQATRRTQKGSYDKGKHSFQILAMTDPSQVEQMAPSAKRFMDALRHGV